MSTYDFAVAEEQRVEVLLDEIRIEIKKSNEIDRRLADAVEQLNELKRQELGLNDELC